MTSSMTRAATSRLSRAVLVRAWICGCALVSLATTSTANGATRTETDAGTTTVVVTMTDSQLALAPSTVPAGPVVFRVVNKGKFPRDFRIAGKQTPKLATGRSTTLEFKSIEKGAHPYLSIGRARLSGSLGAVPACTDPTASTVEVRMTRGTITLSKQAVPCGPVTFVVTNTDSSSAHRLGVALVTSVHRQVVGPKLLPGQTRSTTVNFRSKGSIYYWCGEIEHDEAGEAGFLRVT